MRRLLLSVTVLAVSGLGAFVPSAAAPPPVRTLSVTGTGVEMYPAFDPAIDRYALTTTDTTGGAVDVAATPGPNETVTVSVAGAPVADPTHVTGLQAGDELTVTFGGGPSPHVYRAIYLPAGFPKLTVTSGPRSSFPDLEPGLIAVTLAPYGGLAMPPAYDAIVDRNGVPVYAETVSTTDLNARHFDLKEQPNGDITVERPTTTPGRTGYALTVLDAAHGFQETVRHESAGGLTDTDFHDSVRSNDGSTIVIGYEPNAVTGKTDATIQKIDATGTPIFTWNSGDDPAIAADTMSASSDYAHINSVVSVENGDIIASFRHLSAIYRIATVAHDGFQPGDIIWRLGGRHSDFTFENDRFPGGPCGQHAVSELPNGHLLVFDNGSDGLCVDPADPLGPGIARGTTRITEYALDLAAHTATLVWSYDPTDRYSLFAGSARRMGNGNTLIDWASDTRALAAEVSPTDVVRWELTTPTGSTRYMSYRAALVTALKPTVTVNGPADGATFVAGDPAPAASGSCTDWHGAALDNCTASGITGGLLDISTPGSHTWQVAAEDGAGNTTTVVRHYTVRSPGRLPDSLIRKAGGSWRGDGTYGPAADQTVRQWVRRTRPAVTHWRIQNDGERADGFRLAGAGGHRRFTVRYVSGGADVTAAVVAGTYRTPTLAPGQSVTLRVVVTPTRRAPTGSTHTVTMAAISLNDASRVDRVAAAVTVQR